MNTSGLELWDVCRNNHGGNENSEAANKVTRKGRDTYRIMTYLMSVDDATCSEVAEALGMPHQTTSARFSDMKKSNLIEPGGAKRPTQTGCLAQPWRVKQST